MAHARPPLAVPDLPRLGRLSATVFFPFAALLVGGCNLKQWVGDPRCYTAADCDAKEVCSAGICIEPGSLKALRRCDATRDCSPGLICAPVPRDGEYATRCAPPVTEGEVGAACGSDFDCLAGLRCNLVGFGGHCAATGTTDEGGACTKNDDCLAGLYCSPQGRCDALFTAYPQFDGVVCEDTSKQPLHAFFEVPRSGTAPADFFRLPFPNDARVRGGKLDIADFPDPGPTPLGVDLIKLYVDALTRDFDGFGATPTVTFRFSGPVDPSTVIDANLVYVDLTTGGEIYGRAQARLSSMPARIKYACQDRVTVDHPRGEPLLPGHTYGVYLLRVKGPGGEVAHKDTDLQSVLATTRPSDADLGAAWDAYAPLRAYLAPYPTVVAEISAATVFTVADTTGHMQRLVEAVKIQPAPALTDLTVCDSGVPSPCADGGPQRVCHAADPDYYEIQGRFSVPIYQTGTPPYLTPADGGNIVEVSGVPQLVRSEAVCFALTVPKSPMPAEGWPLVVYHHGTGGSFSSFVTEGVGALMAKSPNGRSAVFGFDAVEHGARRGSSKELPDNLVFNVLNPNSARDNGLQGAVDIVQALRLTGVTIPASLTGAELRFSATTPMVFGHSQGATATPIALAFVPTTHALVLSGSSGGLIDSLLDKTSPVNIKEGMKFLIGEELDDRHPTLTLLQTFFERSDPLNYGPLLIRRPPAGANAKHVFEPYGTGDTYTPSSVQTNIAQAIGLQQESASLLEPLSLPTVARPISSNVGAGGGTLASVTGVVIQYAPTQGEDGHHVSFFEQQAIVDWSSFLLSYATSNLPGIP